MSLINKDNIGKVVKRYNTDAWYIIIPWGDDYTKIQTNEIKPNYTPYDIGVFLGFLYKGSDLEQVYNCRIFNIRSKLLDSNTMIWKSSHDIKTTTNLIYDCDANSIPELKKYMNINFISI